MLRPKDGWSDMQYKKYEVSILDLFSIQALYFFGSILKGLSVYGWFFLQHDQSLQNPVILYQVWVKVHWVYPLVGGVVV